MTPTAHAPSKMLNKSRYYVAFGGITCNPSQALSSEFDSRAIGNCELSVHCFGRSGPDWGDPGDYMETSLDRIHLMLVVIKF